MLPGLFSGDFANFAQGGLGPDTNMGDLINALLGTKTLGLPGVGGGQGDTGGFQSGFRPPPTGAMSMTPPPANFWQGGNFHAPGVSGSPLMTSDVLSRFPQLADIAGGGGPPPMPTPPQGAAATAPAPSLMEPEPAAPAGHHGKKKSLLDKLLSGGLLGIAPALGGGGAGLAGLGGLLPGLLSK